MELISKDALEAKLMLCMDMNRADWSYNKMIMANKMLEILDQEPIIEERKHGYWIEHPEHPVGDCSICGERVPIYSGSKKYKICPYCGAIMDGVFDA